MDNHFFINAGVHFDQPEIPTWHSLTAMDSDLQFFDSSSISSMASSPVSASNSNQSFLIRELIGKLGNICNSSTGTINGTTMDPIPAPNLPSMPEDPTFVERAARFSSIGSRSFNGRNTHLPSKLHRVCSSPSINASEIKNSRKRKGKCRDIPCSSPPKVVENRNESNEKRSKLNPEINDKKTEHSLEEEEEEDEEDENEIKKQSSKQKLPEPPKDYIHVRARRGQATDSHSLAERVRREKISERMKLLQDLVPGCNKVTGKALMLEEIINYVQSLQGQVEFLSMKLASVNPRLDFNHPQENAFQAKRCYPSVYENQLQQNGMGPHCSNPMDPINQSHDLHLPTLDGFNNGVPELCEGDLHAIVQMGFAQNTNLMQPQSLQGSNQAPATKTEF